LLARYNIGEMSRSKNQQLPTLLRQHAPAAPEEVPPDWERVRDRILAALEPYPEAFEAVLAALEQGSVSLLRKSVGGARPR
jgi:hypothetical protein